MKLKNLCIYLSVLCVFSCYEDDITQEEVIQIDETQYIIDAEYNIQITSEDGGGFTGTISMDNQYKIISTQAEMGHFKLLDANKLHETVSIESTNGIQFFYPLLAHENDINNISIQVPSIFNKTQYTQNFNQNIELSPSLSIQFDANSLLLQQTPYAEEVQLFTKTIKDSENNSAITIPDIGTAFNEAGERVFLNPAEVYYVTALSQTNEPLNIQEGKVKLQFTNNQTEYDWWVYDEEVLHWRKVNSENQVGELSSFGFFAYAKNQLGGIIEGQFTSNYSPFLPIQYTLEHSPKAVNYSTNQGYWIQTSPLQEIQAMQVFESCQDYTEHQVVATEFLTSIDPISIYTNADQVNPINYTLKDCNGAALEAGYIFIEENLPYYSSEANQSVFAPACLSEKLVLSSNKEQLLMSPALSWNFESPIHLGSLINCEEILNGYVIMQVDNQDILYANPENYISNDRFVIDVEESENSMLKVAFDNNGQGSYENQSVNLYIEEHNLNDGYLLNCFLSEDGCGTIRAEITHFGNVQGEWIRGTLEGNYWIKLINLQEAIYKDIQVEFLLKRDF